MLFLKENFHVYTKNKRYDMNMILEQDYYIRLMDKNNLLLVFITLAISISIFIML